VLQALVRRGDLDVVTAAVVERDGSTELAQRDRDAMAELSARAGDQRHLAVQPGTARHVRVGAGGLLGRAHAYRRVDG
jgi:hypothetical protein